MSFLLNCIIFILSCIVLIYLTRIFFYLKNKILIYLGNGFDFKHNDDAFAVITGCTDGIGLEYANFFAKKGYRLFLLSRSEEKLNLTKKNIENEFPQCKEIRTLAVDFTKIDIYDQIEKELGQLSCIDVLVNNVGLFYPKPDFFTKLEPQVFMNIINVNVIACIRLTHLCLSKMELQNKGLILNLSSASCVFPMPLVTVYSATKVFLDFFTCALQTEYSSKNIIIQSVVPCYVATKMARIRNPNLLAPTPQDYIDSQVRTIGLEDRTHGFWTHEIQALVGKVGLLILGRKALEFIFLNLAKFYLYLAERKRNSKLD